MTTDGGPAYPFTPNEQQKLPDGTWDQSTEFGDPGMSVRDHFVTALVRKIPYPCTRIEALQVAHDLYNFAQVLVNEKLLRDKTDHLDPAQVKADGHQCGLGAVDPEEEDAMARVKTGDARVTECGSPYDACRRPTG